MKISFDSLKPIHIITNALKELTNTSNFKDEIVNTSISMATGYLSKKIAIGKTGNPIKQVLGMLLQMGVTSLVSKNVDGIKSNAITILSKLFNRKNAVK